MKNVCSNNPGNLVQRFSSYRRMFVAMLFGCGLSASVAFAQPSNDNFADARVFTGESDSGINVDATTQPGEPTTVAWPGRERSPLGGKSVWWKWVAPSTGRYTIKTGDKAGLQPSSDFDTQLGVYKGTALSNLTEVASNESDVNFPGGTSKVEINATQGTTYYILIDGREGQTGNIYLYIVPTRYTLALIASPFADGSVSVDPPPPADGYVAGTKVTITASPAEGVEFFGWSGGTRGKTNPVQVVMNSDKTVVAHFSYDGQLFWQHTNGTIAAWHMVSTQVISAFTYGQVEPGWNLVGVGDFNTNGSSDLLFRDKNGKLLIWLMEGNTRGSEGVFAEVTNTWRAAAVADVSGDFRPDIIFQHTNGYIAAWVMNFLERNTSVPIGVAGAGWQLATAADMDADGDADLLFQHTSGNVAVWLMNGGARTKAVGMGMVGDSWKLVAARDFDGDGDNDLLFQNDLGRLAIWVMNKTAREDSIPLREGQPVNPAWKACAAN